MVANTVSFNGLLERLSLARVTCVGDVMLDQFLEGEVHRLSPEAPIPVIQVRSEKAMPGGAGNVVRNIAALGAKARLISVIGDDHQGRRLKELFASQHNLSVQLVVEERRPTTVKTRYIAARQQLLRADREVTSPINTVTKSTITSSFEEEILARDGVLVLSDYGKGVLKADMISSLINIAKQNNTKVIIDPKGKDFNVYRGADLITPNLNELAKASGMPTNSDDEVITAARQIIQTAGIDAVLATRSEQGMSIITRHDVTHLKAHAREVFDVSGAGDTVVAAVAAALDVGADLKEAATLANIAAGIAVGKNGTAVVDTSEILSVLHKTVLMRSETKISALEEALDKLAGWRKKGLRCGFTNGCFDLLHPGHISLFAQAKETCDKLIVGLNSDHSVRQLKGEGRPIQNESSRSQVLASLADIDIVVIFDDLTPLALIKALRPDVLIKGSDYALKDVVGGELVSEWGGEVFLADILAGHSTTRTIEKIEDTKPYKLD